MSRITQNCYARRVFVSVYNDIQPQICWVFVGVIYPDVPKSGALGRSVHPYYCPENDVGCSSILIFRYTPKCRRILTRVQCWVLIELYTNIGPNLISGKLIDRSTYPGFPGNDLRS